MWQYNIIIYALELIISIGIIQIISPQINSSYNFMGYNKPIKLFKKKCKMKTIISPQKSTKPKDIFYS